MNPRFSRLIGSNFVRTTTGGLYRVIGPSRIGGFMAYSWLAFCGLYLFHRAFAIAVPGAPTRSYSRLVLFWPSLLYWPSSIGKEAWMVFSLGTGAYGAARCLGPERTRVYGADLAGVLLAGRVRPHVAVLLAASTAGTYLARGRRRRGLALAAVAATQGIQAARFLRRSGIRDENVAAALEATVRRTSKLGGAEFTPPIVRSRALWPLVPPTILFRPHPLEAHNPQAMAAAVEGAALFAISAGRLRRLGGVRGQPYAALALAFSLLFCGAFAGVANFGVLARQRVQLLPFYMVLISLPPAERRRGFPFRRP
jgi:hypothetical protein